MQLASSKRVPWPSKCRGLIAHRLVTSKPFPGRPHQSSCQTQRSALSTLAAQKDGAPIKVARVYKDMTKGKPCAEPGSNNHREHVTERRAAGVSEEMGNERATSLPSRDGGEAH